MDSHVRRPPDGVGEVFERLDQVARRLRQIHESTISRSGLTPAQLFLLQQLWRRDRQPLKDLADACSCTRATITGVVDTLEKKGLVGREPNPDDRRSLLAAVTKKGRALRGTVPDLEQLFGCCCAGLSQDELGTLHALLGKLESSLSGGPRVRQILWSMRQRLCRRHLSRRRVRVGSCPP